MEIIIPAVLIGILAGLFVGVICSVVVGARRERFGSRLGFWLLTILLSIMPIALIIALISPAGQLVFGGAYLLIELLFLLIIFRLIGRRAVWISFLAVVCCFAAGSGLYYRHQSYVQSLAVVAEPSNLLWEYDPANGNNALAALDEPSSLSLTDGLPRLDGATALYPVYAAFANAVYPVESINPPIGENEFFAAFASSEVLACNTTTDAYKRLVDGEADVIFVAGPSDAQLQYAADCGEEMFFTPIGRECFVFFVNAQNPVNGLTVDEIRGIYSGKITRWNELGADLGKIRAFQRDEGSGSQSMLVRFMGDTPLMEARTENVVAGMGGIIERTADYRNFPDAIGYTFRFYATEMVQNGEIKLLEVNGVAPTKENIINGSYPISSEFYAVTLASNDNPNVHALIEWILSEEGQALIDQTGYVALN